MSRLISYTPDLIPYNFDNRIASCCFNGVWMLYDDYFFNRDNFKVFHFFWKPNHSFFKAKFIIRISLWRITPYCLGFIHNKKQRKKASKVV